MKFYNYTSDFPYCYNENIAAAVPDAVGHHLRRVRRSSTPLVGWWSVAGATDARRTSKSDRGSRRAVTCRTSSPTCCSTTTKTTTTTSWRRTRTRTIWISRVTSSRRRRRRRRSSTTTAVRTSTPSCATTTTANRRRTASCDRARPVLALSVNHQLNAGQFTPPVTTPFRRRVESRRPV